MVIIYNTIIHIYTRIYNDDNFAAGQDNISYIKAFKS